MQSDCERSAPEVLPSQAPTPRKIPYKNSGLLSSSTKGGQKMAVDPSSMRGAFYDFRLFFVYAPLRLRPV